jgi:hypothetical protein
MRIKEEGVRRVAVNVLFTSLVHVSRPYHREVVSMLVADDAVEHTVGHLAKTGVDTLACAMLVQLAEDPDVQGRLFAKGVADQLLELIARHVREVGTL